MTGVLLDLATHPVDQWAVALNGKLLPVRFSNHGEASRHLREMLVKMAQDPTPASAVLLLAAQ